MPLSFRHFKQILEDWLSYVIGHSTLTDINPGSVLRTLGEASAIEYAQLYVQMQKLLDLFSIDKASGSDLDERALDFNMYRLQPTKSTGTIDISDSAISPSSVALSTTVAPLTGGGSTQIQIQTIDYASFPASGSVILDRADSVKRELVAYTSKTAPDLLNLAGTVSFSHIVGTTVNLSTVGSDRTIPAGTIVKNKSIPEVKYETTVSAILYDGEYKTANIAVQSLETGSATLLAVGQLTVFESLPFPTAVVTNSYVTINGRDLELDADLRLRIKEQQQSLSSSTRLRIESEALKVSITATGQRVVTAKCIEPISPGVSTLYINDGSATYSPTTVSVNMSEFLLGNSEASERRTTFAFWPIINNSERLYVSLDRGTTTSVGVNTLTDSIKTWTINQWIGFRVKDSNNVIYSIASNTATALTLTGGYTPAVGAYAIFDPSNTLYPTGSLLTKTTDYIINNNNGQIELTVASFPTGLAVHDALLAYYNGSLSAYSYYDGLLREVQRVINGDPTDLITYPGVAAAGTIVNITKPTIVTIIIVGTLSAQPGIDEATITDSVKNSILTYINNLGIGADVLRSDLIVAAKSVSGVYDFDLLSPLVNIAIANNELAKSTLTDITVT